MPAYCVLLDANFFLIPAQFHIDIYSELERQVPGSFEILLPDIAIGELEAKVKRNVQDHKGSRGSLGRQLTLARQIAQQHNVKDVHVERVAGKPVDALLLLLATDIKARGSIVIIATNDAALRQKAQAAGHAIAWLRAKKVVEVSIR
jgi:rRNA-processing protein FCF1